ncbi:MAG: hypothetical protein AUK53_01260 [Betaproteobacteria bacterium CG2_30_59_46]|nr:MAG: hypothetical protein AUK53_01260 [Betaproteobacteria bacterium CG2_30_59_46]
MSNSDISWLSEPHTHDLFLQFPLPLAVLDRNDEIKLLNKCFIDTFDATCLESGPLRQVLSDPNRMTQTVTLPQRDGRQAEVHVHAVNVGEDLILIFEESADTVYNEELAEFRQRITELEKLSSTDRLTGAWNRVHFDKTLQSELSRSVRYRQPLSLIFFDIDHFKLVNDTYGHAIGDEVLRELVKVVSENIRTSDMLFRWGGEEFVILAPSTSYGSAAKLAETLRARIERHEIETVGNITVSLGVAEHISGESETIWFCRVDKALYAAKDSGRNRVVIDPRGSSDAWTEGQSATILHLKWHESYDCGEPTIDQEHRKLFDLANTLINAAFKRESNPLEFDEALKKLLAHVAQHFADEEVILAQHHYAGLEVQAQAHKRLIERALQLRDATAAGGVTVGELVDFIAGEVVSRHMLQTDREFYPLFDKSLSSSAG